MVNDMKLIPFQLFKGLPNWKILKVKRNIVATSSVSFSMFIRRYCKDLKIIWLSSNSSYFGLIRLEPKLLQDTGLI